MPQQAPFRYLQGRQQRLRMLLRYTHIKNLSGNRLENPSSGPWGIAAVIATTLYPLCDIYNLFSKHIGIASPLLAITSPSQSQMVKCRDNRQDSLPHRYILFLLSADMYQYRSFSFFALVSTFSSSSKLCPSIGPKYLKPNSSKIIPGIIIFDCALNSPQCFGCTLSNGRYLI